MRALTDDEARVFHRLLNRLNVKKKRNVLRQRYADAKKTLDQAGFSIPPQMTDFAAVIGWPEKTCSVLSRRLRPRGFAGPESELLTRVQDYFDGADVAMAERLAIDSAVRHGASFVFVTKGEVSAGEPEVLLSVRSALDATADRDPRSQRIVSALERVDGGFNLYLPGRTLLVVRDTAKGWGVPDDGEFETTPGRVLCTPYVHGLSLDRPFGRSRITRPVMAYTDMAVRVMLRQEVSAEFFSSPQRYMLGATGDMFVGPNGEPRTGWEATLGALLAVPDAEDEIGEKTRVNVGQFTQQSMSPHSEHLRSVAMMFSGETSIPVGYLGIVQDNPSSAEAINAAEADLVSVAEAETVPLSSARVDLARNVAAVQEGDFTDAMASDLSKLQSLWRSPSTPTQAATADATMKKISALPWLADSDVVLEDIGYDAPTIGRLRSDRRAGQVAGLVASLGERAAGAQADPEIARLASARSEGDAESDADAGEGARDAALTIKAKGDALGVLIRAGVEPETAARTVGLDGLQFVPGLQPVSVRSTAEAS